LSAVLRLLAGFRLIGDRRLVVGRPLFDDLSVVV